MDGSVYKFHPTFGRKTRRTVARLVCDCIQFEIILSEDGSGRGAALAAAVGAKQRAKAAAAAVATTAARAAANAATAAR